MMKRGAYFVERGERRGGREGGEGGREEGRRREGGKAWRWEWYRMGDQVFDVEWKSRATAQSAGLRWRQ